MTFNELKTEVERIYHSKFRNSLCRVTFSTCMENVIYIDCYLSNGKNERPGYTLENDMMHVSISAVFPEDYDGSNVLPDGLTIDPLDRNFRTISENFSGYRGGHRVGFRPCVGNAEKLIRVFTSFVSNLYKDMKSEYLNNNLFPEDMAVIAMKKYI